ncbi:MAG: D amino acid oxidase (DAO) family protein [Rhodospirillaceae bacterium]|nr:D amino acid oxidase (DAO) family protein [Rhodospirillaceae bacterium]
MNFLRFAHDYRDCIADDFKALYCIGAQNSLVTKHQFEKFCNQIGAAYQPAGEPLQKLFNLDLIDAVYEVTEYAFDARALAGIVSREMEAACVDILLGVTVEDVKTEEDGLLLSLAQGNDRLELQSTRVFNCTYAGLNFVAPGMPAGRARLKYEIAEIALITPPEQLAGLGVTVMDGPFFSCMPFPAKGCHSLTHVRYTPHFAWQDAEAGAVHPYDVLNNSAPCSRHRYMIADATRYLPLLKDAHYEQSLFEIKAILLSNEVDDGRPILFQQHGDMAEMYSILGGKIDNIFDVKEAMRNVLGTTADPRHVTKQAVEGT